MSESERELSVAPPVEIVDENDLQPDDDLQIRELLCLCFPDWAEIFQHRRLWHNTPPVYSVIIREHGKIVGHTAVVVRMITTTWNFRYNVASIQGVCVAPDRRRIGLSLCLLQTAMREAVRREFPFAILYCKEFLVPFYTSQGWKLADDSVVMWNTRDLPISMRSNCPMYCELADISFPEGPLDVHSPETV
ncbi:MAG: GNAT family N-acetyltransferase [Planctomycetaceae bacterium]|nr:GNAT family N-acetyltransferase [Planctomycetaceae bacterium]